jgi:hypothetical protein
VPARSSNGRDTSPFERFWRTFPTRGSHSNPKVPARRKFERALKSGVECEIIIQAAANYALAVKANHTDPQYIVQAQTWLGQERWQEYQQEPEPAGIDDETDKLYRDIGVEGF